MSETIETKRLLSCVPVILNLFHNTLSVQGFYIKFFLLLFLPLGCALFHLCLGTLLCRILRKKMLCARTLQSMNVDTIFAKLSNLSSCKENPKKKKKRLHQDWNACLLRHWRKCFTTTCLTSRWEQIIDKFYLH